MAKKSSLSAFQEKPSLRIYEAELPQLKDWKIDGEYTLEVKVKLRSLGKDEYMDDPKLWGSFRVLSVKSDDDGDDVAKGMDSVKPEYVRKPQK